MKIQLLLSHLVYNDGYCEHARNMVDALKGHLEISIINDIGSSTNKFSHLLDGESLQIVPQNQPDIPVMYITPNHNRYHLLPNQYSIIRTMFESDRIHPNWVEKFNRADNVLVPSTFNYKTFSGSGVATDKLAVLRDAVDSRLFQRFSRPYPLKSNKQFKYLSIFSSRYFFYRKGVDLLLKAYLDLFNKSDDVCLVIKTDIGESELYRMLSLQPHAQWPEIEVISETLQEEELYGLYHAVDAYVLPSRGEGIGRPYLYEMLKGLPTIASGWGGNMEFMSEENAFLIKYHLKEIPLDTYYPLFYGGNFAEPDSRDLQEKMWTVYNHKEIAKQKGEKAREKIAGDFSFRGLAEQFLNIFEKNEPGGSVNKSSPFDLFYRLIPLPFPGSAKNLQTGPQRVSQKDIRKIAVYGTGSAGQQAARWLAKCEEIETVHFLDREADNQSFCGSKLFHYSQVEPGAYDLLLIAADRRFLNQIMQRLKGFSDIPVYWFY